MKTLRVKPLKVKRITKLSAVIGNAKRTNDAVKGKEETPRISKVLKKKLNIKNKVLMKHGKLVNPTLRTKSVEESLGESEKKMIKVDRSKLFTSLEADIAATKGVNIQPAASQMNNKLQKSVAVREVERMKLVQSSAVYQSNPLDAIKSHLESIANAKKEKISNADKSKKTKQKKNKSKQQKPFPEEDVDMTY